VSSAPSRPRRGRTAEAPGLVVRDEAQPRIRGRASYAAGRSTASAPAARTPRAWIEGGVPVVAADVEAGARAGPASAEAAHRRFLRRQRRLPRRPRRLPQAGGGPTAVQPGRGGARTVWIRRGVAAHDRARHDRCRPGGTRRGVGAHDGRWRPDARLAVEDDRVARTPAVGAKVEVGDGLCAAAGRFEPGQQRPRRAAGHDDRRGQDAPPRDAAPADGVSAARQAGRRAARDPCMPPRDALRARRRTPDEGRRTGWRCARRSSRKTPTGTGGRSGRPPCRTALGRAGRQPWSSRGATAARRWTAAPPTRPGRR
jgi:hypothetical protein